MTYLGQSVTQIDGSRFQYANCVLASTTCLGDTSSLGYWEISPARLRVLSGDDIGGVTYDTAKATMKRASNGEVDLTVLYWALQTSSQSTLDNILDSPRVTGISIDARVTRYTPFRTGTFTGGHTLVAGAKRFVTVYPDGRPSYRRKEVLVMDPGHSDVKWVWWPWNLLIQAAHARTGNSTIHVLYTRDLANVYRKAHTDGAIRSTPKAVSTNKIGRLEAGTTYHVLSTQKGGRYSLAGRNLIGWNKIGAGKYCVAKVR